MTALRRLAYVALGFAYVHIVFGAIVRITGSGMGCGDHWPLCQGQLFPPLDRMDLVIEITHRWLAAGLTTTILAFFATALLKRREPWVGGRGGVLRPAALAVALVLTAAIFGAIVVKLELTNPHMIVVHLGIAMTLLAVLVVATMRAGGLGALQLKQGDASARTWRGTRIAAGLALVVVVLGALTANLPGANGACVGFPHCREIVSRGEPLHVHLTHRVLAFLLFFHVIGLALAVRRRGEHPLVRRAAWTLVGVIVLQIVVAAVLVELRLPAVWRSLHEAVGTAVWLAAFVFAMIARRGARGALGFAADHPELRRPVAAATAAAMLAVEPAMGAMDAHAEPAWTDAPATMVAEAPAETPETSALAALVEQPDAPALASQLMVDDAAVEQSVVELAVFDTSFTYEPYEPPAILSAPASVDLTTEDTEVTETLAEPEVVEEPFTVDFTTEDTEVTESMDVSSSVTSVSSVVNAVAESPEPSFEIFPTEPDEDEPVAVVEAVDDEELEEQDANAAALAQLDRESASAIPVEPSVSSVVESPSAELAVEAEAPVKKRPPTLAVIIARGADF